MMTILSMFSHWFYPNLEFLSDIHMFKNVDISLMNLLKLLWIKLLLCFLAVCIISENQ